MACTALPTACLIMATALAAPLGAQTGPAGGGTDVRVPLSGRLTNGGSPLEGATVYLEQVSGPATPRPLRPVVIDQEHLRFTPQSLAVTPGTRVRFRNSDPVMHNIFSPGPEAFDLGTHGNDTVVERTLREEGVHVMLCNIHPEMVAYVSVVPSPYFSVVGATGDFSLPPAPAGEYVLHVWLPRRGSEHTLPLRIDPDSNLPLELVILGGELSRR